MIDHLTQDLRYAARQLARAPWFTLIAVVSLGVGITVAVTVFSLLNSILFKPLPVPDADAVLHIYTSARPGEAARGRSAYLDLIEYQRSGVFLAVAAHSRISTTVSANEQAPYRATTVFVSPNYFQTLQLRLVEGRPFNVEGAEQEIIISERFRRRMFKPDQPVLGAIVRVNNMPLTIVGVAPAEFRDIEIGSSPVAWIAEPQTQYVFGRSWANDRDLRYYRIIGRLAPGQTEDAATARLGRTARELADLYPGSWREEGGAPRRVALLTQREGAVDLTDPDTIAAFATITALVMVVLMLACTNVAGLLLARALTRRHEIAVRLTLGATRARLMTQLMTEAVLIAGLGGVAGFLGSQWAIMYASKKPIFDVFDLAPDWRVLVMTAAVSLACALTFGITPIGQALRVDVRSGMAGLGIVGERGGVRGRLIALQVCLSALLMLIAFSAARGVRSELYTDVGFNTDGVLVAELGLLEFRRDSMRRREFIDDATSILRSLQGVQHVTATLRLPVSTWEPRWDTKVELPNGGSTAVRYNNVGEGYFETLGIPLINGRTLRPEDSGAAVRPAVVNRAFIDAYGGAMLGRQLTIGEGQQVIVVGVVENAKHRTTDKVDEPYLYEARRPNSWNNTNRMYLVARTRPDLQQDIMTQLIRRLRDRYPDRVPPTVESLRSSLDRATAPQRVIGSIALGIGAMELALATIGLYSLLLYALLARTREVGLRMALGAGSVHASFTVIRDGLRFVAVGTVMGLVLCVPAAMFTARNFVGAKASDPIPFLFVLLAILVSSAGAAFIPARRAARIQPMSALRHE